MIVGSFVWHLFRTLRRSFGRIALWFLITGLIAAIVVELVYIFQGGWQSPQNPSTLTHLIALVLGIAVGYAFSATLMVVEIIRDLYLTMEEIEHDVRNEFNTAAGLASTVVQGAGSVTGKVVGHTTDRR